MAATTFHSVIIVFWKETALLLLLLLCICWDVKPYSTISCVLMQQMVSKRDRMTYEKIADLFSENNNRQKLR